MLRTPFAALVAAVLVMASPAFASGVPMIRFCARAGDVAAAMRTAPDVSVAWHRGRDLERLLAAFNGAPPATSYQADEILVATDGRTGERLFLFLSGCLVTMDDMPLGWSRRQLGEGV